MKKFLLFLVCGLFSSSLEASYRRGPRHRDWDSDRSSRPWRHSPNGDRDASRERYGGTVGAVDDIHYRVSLLENRATELDLANRSLRLTLDQSQATTAAQIAQTQAWASRFLTETDKLRMTTAEQIARVQAQVKQLREAVDLMQLESAKERAIKLLQSSNSSSESDQAKLKNTFRQLRDRLAVSAVSDDPPAGSPPPDSE